MNGSSSTPPKLPTMPRWLLYVIIIAVVASWIPLALIARSRAMQSDRPRIHVFLDMDEQPKYLAQSQHPLYADGRAMRPPVEGTVPRFHIDDEAGARAETFDDDRGYDPEDDHYYRGYETDENDQPVLVETDSGAIPRWFTGYPEQVEVDEDLLRRGRERYNIYCAVCHGHAGYGDGMVQRRASRLAAESPGWVPPVDLHATDPDSGELLYGGERSPTGRLFNIITHGIRTMPAYGTQIDVEDRWAIVAYVRALQLSQNFPADELPDDLQGQIGNNNSGNSGDGM